MRRLSLFRLWSVASAAWLLALAAPAEGVAISSSDNRVNLVAPASDPGWNNIAHLSNASAVYLGNRWMITADHVADAPVRFSDGRVFDISVGSDVGFRNEGNPFASDPDLRMFRLTTDPGLPALTLATSTPATNTTVMMIGAGRERAPDLIGYRVSNAGVWTQVALPFASRFGFELLSTSRMQWGTNQVVSGTPSLANGSTMTFATQFDRTTHGFEAQAETGDSGGGVFEFTDGTWKLVGLMDAVQQLPGQPTNTTVNGDQTFSIDLASYQSQIHAVMSRADSPWQNQINHYDVDRSGKLGAMDAIRVINQLIASGGVHTLAGLPQASDSLVDVNGDGLLGSLDAGQIINALIGTAASSSHGGSLVPEPSGLALAVLGFLAVVLARSVTKFRRAGVPSAS